MDYKKMIGTTLPTTTSGSPPRKDINLVEGLVFVLNLFAPFLIVFVSLVYIAYWLTEHTTGLDKLLLPITFIFVAFDLVFVFLLRYRKIREVLMFVASTACSAIVWIVLCILLCLYALSVNPGQGGTYSSLLLIWVIIPIMTILTFLIAVVLSISRIASDLVWAAVCSGNKELNPPKPGN